MQDVLDRHGVVKGLSRGSGLTLCGSLEGNGSWKVCWQAHFLVWDLYSGGRFLGFSPAARSGMQFLRFLFQAGVRSPQHLSGVVAGLSR